MAAQFSALKKTWIIVGALVVLCAVLNPSRAQHLSSIREHARCDAPYDLDENKLANFGFEYRSYFVCSAMRKPEGTYTLGVLGYISCTERLRPALLSLAPDKK